MARTNPHGLTDQQERFCLNYVTNGGNASKAYRDAGYSENGARHSAWRLLTNANVQERIDELFQETAQRVKVTQEDVLRKLVEKSLLGQAQTESAEVKCTELLGKHLGMFPTKVEIEFAAERRRLVDGVLDAFQIATSSLDEGDAERVRAVFGERVSQIVRG
jgi:phage terminase small subunit